jgi:hypothetical protein
MGFFNEIRCIYKKCFLFIINNDIINILEIYLWHKKQKFTLRTLIQAKAKNGKSLSGEVKPIPEAWKIAQ